MDAGSRVRLVAVATVGGVLLSAQAPAATAPALEFEMASVKPQPTVPPNPPVLQPPDRLLSSGDRVAAASRQDSLARTPHMTFRAPKPLEAGEWVIYGGHPGALKEPKTGEIVWPFQSFTWRATDVTDTNIVLHVDFPNLFWPGHEEKKMNDNLGGISGGPVFRINEVLDPETKKVLTVGFELVGIIQEYSEMMDTVRARHIRHVLADGSLKPL